MNFVKSQSAVLERMLQQNYGLIKTSSYEHFLLSFTTLILIFDWWLGKCCTVMNRNWILFLSNTEKMEDLTNSKGSDLTMSCQEIPIETPGKFCLYKDDSHQPVTALFSQIISKRLVEFRCSLIILLHAHQNIKFLVVIWFSISIDFWDDKVMIIIKTDRLHLDYMTAIVDYMKSVLCI